MKIISFGLWVWFVFVTSAWGGEADIVKADVTPQANGRYHISVTVRHADKGWDHYADRWELLTPEGEVIATRVLRHPHVNEQPFTRSLSDVRIPPQIKILTIRAHDSVHGYGGKPLTLEMSRP